MGRSPRDRPRGRRGADRRSPGRAAGSRRLRVLPDTNVLVSAAIASGPPRRILELAQAGRIELVIPNLVVEELIRVLAGRRGWERARLLEFLTVLHAVASEMPEAPPTAEPLTGDPDDDRILACAIANRVDAIASGNRRHLLPLGTSRGVRIVSPQALVAEIRQRDA